MMSQKGILSFVILLILLASCKNNRINELKESEGRFLVEVAVSAGDHIDQLHGDTLEFLAFPFNLGVYEDKKMRKREVIIVGKKIRSGQNVSVLPFAKLTYKEKDGRNIQVVVARPTKASLITAKVENYFELISVHYGVQKMIETWILYAKGYGETYDIKWESEEAAIEFITS